MELKTFLLPLRLGLLTAFHQSNEVIFRSCASFCFLCTIDRLFLNDFGVCKGGLPVCFFPVFGQLNVPFKQGGHVWLLHGKVQT